MTVFAFQAGYLWLLLKPLNLKGVLGAASDYEDVSPHLCEGEEQGHVAADALLLQVLTRPDALPCRSNLHDHVSDVCV